MSRILSEPVTVLSCLCPVAWQCCKTLNCLKSTPHYAQFKGLVPDLAGHLQSALLYASVCLHMSQGQSTHVQHDTDTSVDLDVIMGQVDMMSIRFCSPWPCQDQGPLITCIELQFLALNALGRIVGDHQGCRL